MKILALIPLVLLLGCPQDPDDTDLDTDTDTVAPVPAAEGDPATVELAGTCALADHRGEFTISDFETYTIVDGSMADGVVPVTILQEVSSEGDCRLMLRENPFCEDGCGQDETCDFDGTCIDYPTALDLGEVTIAGLADDVRMQPVQPGFRYFNTSLPHPAMQDGVLVQLRAEGDSVDSFDLHGIGVAPLTIAEDAWVLEQGQDLTIAWTEASGRAHVALALRIDQHGTSPATLFCEFEDDGQGTVPAQMVDDLIDAGVTGFPNGSLTRRTVDNAEVGGGCIDLTTQSRRVPSVRVSGFTPCNTQADCPSGLTCNTTLQICE